MLRQLMCVGQPSLVPTFLLYRGFVGLSRDLELFYENHSQARLIWEEKIEVYAAYTVDAVTASEEDIVVDEVIVCTISDADFQ